MSEKGAGQKKPNHSQGDGQKRWTLAEIAAASISAAILLVVVAAVLYLWAFSADEPPLLQATQAGSVREAGGSFYVPIEVRNAGDRAVTGVSVSAELEAGGELVESGELQFEWLSGGAAERGTFIFTQDPSGKDLVIRVVGYRIP